MEPGKKQRALLVVAGGRAIPNVLSLLELKPQIVHIILSEQGWEHEQAFKDIAHSIGCHVKTIPNIDAYDFDVCLRACEDACKLDPDEKLAIDNELEWTFDITSAPKVTGIAAYEIAKQKGFSCWHVDAQRDRHVSLIKQVEIDTAKFFHLTLDDYMKAQHRIWSIRPGPTPDYREVIMRWAGIVRELARLSGTDEHAKDTLELLSALHDKKPDNLIPLPAHLARTPLLQLAVDEGSLKVEGRHTSKMVCQFVSKEAAKLLGTGDWLEFYVWFEAINIGLADETHCQWGCSIFDGPVEKELDLALMYNAQLMVAECKTAKDTYEAKRGHLHKLQAKANVLGGSYVCKLFITNQQAQGSSYKSFCDQAEQYKIVVVTGEMLPEIGQILKKEATKPTYQRI